MAEIKLILDTCTYFRMRILYEEIFQIHFQIDMKSYCFVTHESIFNEYKQQSRLRLKYPRPPILPAPKKKKLIKVKPHELDDFENHIAYIDYMESFNTGANTLSDVDKSCIGIQLLNQDTTILISDDKLLFKIAKEAGSDVMTGGGLIEMLYKNNIINKIEINKFLKYLNSIDDYSKTYDNLKLLF